MDKESAVESLTDTMAKFTAYIGKRLPKDVTAKLHDLRTTATRRRRTSSIVRAARTRA